MAATVTKRCAKCGRTSNVKPRERRCKWLETNAMGKSGYWCYGHLTKIAPLKPKKKAKAVKLTFGDEEEG